MFRPKCAVIIAAGGRGERSGLGFPKQLFRIGDKEIVYHTVMKFVETELVDEIVIAAGEESIARIKELCFGLPKVSRVVPGGATRQASVYEGLKNVSEDARIILVHDAARPFLTRGLIKAVYEGAAEYGACIPAVKVKDALRLDRGGFAYMGSDMSGAVCVQTPQGFEKALLLRAHERAAEQGFSCADDSGLLEYIGVPVRILKGEELNIKITTETDLKLAEAIRLPLNTSD